VKIKEENAKPEKGLISPRMSPLIWNQEGRQSSGEGGGLESPHGTEGDGGAKGSR
jgi:hypothetical protein